MINGEDRDDDVTPIREMAKRLRKPKTTIDRQCRTAIRKLWNARLRKGRKSA